MRPHDSLVTPSACSLHVGCVLHLAHHVGGLGCESFLGGVGCESLLCHVGGLGCENLLSHVSGLGCESLLCHVCGLGCESLLRHVCGLGCESLLRHVSSLGLICMDLLPRSLILHLASSFIFQRSHGLDVLHDHVLSFHDHFLAGWSVACVILHRTFLARFLSD